MLACAGGDFQRGTALAEGTEQRIEDVLFVAVGGRAMEEVRHLGRIEIEMVCSIDRIQHSPQISLEASSGKDQTTRRP